jgi:hypothetical protein
MRFAGEFVGGSPILREIRFIFKRMRNGLAEREGFEPPEDYSSTVFKSSQCVLFHTSTPIRTF